jgi:hypothetical protein
MHSALNLSPTDFQKLFSSSNTTLNLFLDNHEYSLSPEQLMLIAPNALYWFQENSTPYIIHPSINQTLSVQFLKDVSSTFDRLHSLFIKEEEIMIKPNELAHFEFHGIALNNSDLLCACENVRLLKSPYPYRLSFEGISRIPISIIAKYETIPIQINEDTFFVNPNFMGMLSRRVEEHLKFNPTERFIIHILPDIDISSYQSLMLSIRNFFRGYRLDLSKFSLEVVIKFAESLQISSFAPYIEVHAKMPNSIDYSFEILQTGIFRQESSLHMSWKLLLPLLPIIFIKFSKTRSTLDYFNRSAFMHLI